MRDGIDKIDEKYSFCVSQTEKLKEKLKRREDLLTKEREKTEWQMSVWNKVLGFDIELLDKEPSGTDIDGNYALKFSKVDSRDSNRTVTVKVSIVSNKVKSKSASTTV